MSLTTRYLYANVRRWLNTDCAATRCANETAAFQFDRSKSINIFSLLRECTLVSLYSQITHFAKFYKDYTAEAVRKTVRGYYGDTAGTILDKRWQVIKYELSVNICSNDNANQKLAVFGIPFVDPALTGHWLYVMLPR
jgi:hypothetical protein